MPAERYFFAGPLEVGDSISLEDGECHHLVKVMRNQCGDRVQVCNGKGLLASGCIEAINRAEATIEIEEILTVEKEPAALILAQALPKANRLECIVEKATELGMTELWLFCGERSDKEKGRMPRLERMQLQLIAAMKQCGRLFLPLVRLMPALCDWNAAAAVEGGKFFGDLSPEAVPFCSLYQQGMLQGAITAFVGPEGGFSNREHQLLQQLGAVGISLHKNILRTDTAAIVMLALLSQLQGPIAA